jgi:hypothetical protein
MILWRFAGAALHRRVPLGTRSLVESRRCNAARCLHQTLMEVDDDPRVEARR